MAYTPGNPFGEEEEQLGAPGAMGAPSVSGPSIGSTASVGGTVAGSSPVTQNNGGGAGTGFTNIDRVLAANKGASGAVKQRADQALAKDASAFGTKLGEAQTAMNAAPGVVDPTKLVGDVMASVTNTTDFGAAGSTSPQLGSGVSNTTDLGKAATGTYQQPAGATQGATGKSVPRGTPGSTADVQTKAIDAAKNALNAQYTAPLEVGYDVGNTEEAKRAKALSDAQTAGKQIAADTGTLAGYTGLDAIDRAIYGSAQENPTLQAAQAAGAAQIGEQTTKSKDFAAASKGKSEALAKNKEDIRAAFGSQVDKIRSEAQTAADNANTADDALFSQKGEKDTWTPGSGNATADQFINAGGLNAIGKVLGDEGLANEKAGPAYVPGTLTPYQPPAPLPDLEVGSQRSSTTQQVANGVRGLDPDQLAEYQAIRKNNPDMTPADAAEEAKHTVDQRKNPNVANINLTGNDTDPGFDAEVNRQNYEELVKKGEGLTGIQGAIMQMLSSLGGA